MFEAAFKAKLEDMGEGAVVKLGGEPKSQVSNRKSQFANGSRTPSKMIHVRLSMLSKTISTQRRAEAEMRFYSIQFVGD